MAFSGFKNTTFKASVVSPSGLPHYKGRTICYENGRRLWQQTSTIYRMSRGDALADAQRMAHDHIVSQFISADTQR
jgi:hypothetical protein